MAVYPSYYFVILLFCISCDEVNVNDTAYNIPIDIYHDYPIVDVRITNIIPFELTKESAFRRPHKIIELPMRYFVMDRSENKIHTFSKTGKYLGSINRKGNGPGEYITLTDININPSSKSLEILDPRGKLIGLALDDLSNVTEEIFFQGIRNVANFHLLNEDMIIIYSFAYIGEKTIRFYSRKEDQIVKEILESNVIDTRGGMTLGMSPFRVWDNSVKFTDINTYYSYKINEKNLDLDPEIYIDAGNNAFDFKSIADKDHTYDIFNHMVENKKAFPVTIIFENDDFLSFGLYFEKSIRTFVVKKTDHSIYKLNMPEYTSNLMDFLTICNGLNTDRFRGIVTNPGMAEKIFEKAIYDKAIENQINNLKSGDNPVIFEYDLVF